MQVEVFEIPFAGAPEIPCRERIYAFPTVMYAATSLPRALTRGRMRGIPRSAGQIGVFQQPVKIRFLNLVIFTRPSGLVLERGGDDGPV